MASQTYTDSVTLTAAAEFNKFDTAAYAQLTGVAGTNTVTATGPANLTLATSPILWFIPAVTNSGATTLNITPSGGAALGAKNVFCGGSACVGGELVASVPIGVVYDGTQYNIIGNPVVKGTTASTFTFDGSGGSTGSVTIVLAKVVKVVTAHIPAILATTGTGSASLVSDTAVAAAFRPTSTQYAPCAVIQNNGANVTVIGLMSIASSGIITVQRDTTGTAWTNTATGGVSTEFNFTYYIG